MATPLYTLMRFEGNCDLDDRALPGRRGDRQPAALVRPPALPTGDRRWRLEMISDRAARLYPGYEYHLSWAEPDQALARALDVPLQTLAVAHAYLDTGWQAWQLSELAQEDSFRL